MAGSQRVVAHSAIAIVMGGSLAGLLPTAATAEPYCARSTGQARRVYEWSRYCPEPRGAVRERLMPEVLGTLGEAQRYRPRHRPRPLTGTEPWVGWRKRYPPPGRQTRPAFPPRSRPSENVRHGPVRHGGGARVDDRPGMIAGRGPTGHPGGAGSRAAGRVPPEGPAARGATPGRRGTTAARPGGGGRPHGHDAPPPWRRHTSAPDRPATSGPAETPGRAGTGSPPGPVIAPGRAATAGRHGAQRAHAAGARGTVPERHAADRHASGRRHADAAARDPRITQHAVGSDAVSDAGRSTDAERKVWTIRRIGSGDDGLAALRFGVTLVLGLVVAAGTLLLMRITRVIPLSSGDEGQGRRPPSGTRRCGCRSARPLRFLRAGEGRTAAWAVGRPDAAHPAAAGDAPPPEGGRRPRAFARALLRGRRPGGPASGAGRGTAADGRVPGERRSPVPSPRRPRRWWGGRSGDGPAGGSRTAQAPPAVPGEAAGDATAHPVPGTAAAGTSSAAPPPALQVVSPAGARVLVRLLGGIVIEGPGGRIDCTTGRDLPDLLGLLAVHRDGLTREKAHELLWPDVDLSDYDRFHSRKKEIRRRLRRALGDPVRETVLIRQVSHRYSLNTDLIGVDYWQLTEALAAAAAADGLRERLTVLRRVADLYTGPFLPGGTRQWSVPIAEDLRKNVVRALTTLIEHEHETTRLIALLERALELDPCNEPLRRRQMRLHADLGRVDEAHRSYQALVAALEDLGGLRPSPLTTALYHRLAGRPAE